MRKELLFIMLAVSFGVDSRIDAGEKAPNFVLIVADDLGAYDLACYGRVEHRTPNIDALAFEGLRFTDAYCASPLCSASRAALLTGQHPARLHLTSYLPGRGDAPSQLLLQPAMHSALPPDEATLAKVLSRLGYRTGLFGKWHLGDGPSSPQEMGFDTVLQPPSNADPLSQGGAKSEFTISERAVQFMNHSRDQPFFCYLPHHSPHIPLAAAEEEVARYEGAYSPLYAASLERLDRSVGRVLEAVRRLSDSRETIVIFTSDNGGLHVPEGHADPVTHNGTFRAGKGFLYEGGIRVPLIVWSSSKSFGQPRVVSEPITLMDLCPTLLRLAGIDSEKQIGPLDGVDLSRQFRGEAAFDANRELYWHFPHYSNQGGRPGASIRSGQWKLMVSFEDSQVELYDLSVDPGETFDRSESMSSIAETLRQRLERWLDSVGAQECGPNPDAEIALHDRIYRDIDPSRMKPAATAVETDESWRSWRHEMNFVVKDSQTSLRSPVGSKRLLAAEGRVHGEKIRYEPEPNKNVIGYWTEVSDWVDWEFQLDQPGEYEVEIQYGCGPRQGGSSVKVVCGDQSLDFVVRETGHFQKMIYVRIGTMTLEAGKQRLEVRPISKAGVAIMDIRKVILRLKRPNQP